MFTWKISIQLDTCRRSFQSSFSSYRFILLICDLQFDSIINLHIHLRYELQLQEKKNKKKSTIIYVSFSIELYDHVSTLFSSNILQIHQHLVLY